MDVQRIVAAFPTPDDAIAAARDLRGHGIRATIDSPTQVLGAEGEMDEEARNLAPAGLAMGPPQMTRGSMRGGGVGSIAGFVVGFVVGALWPGFGAFGVLASGLIVALIGAAAGGVAGFVMGGALGAMDAAGATDMGGTRSLPLISERDVLVQVAPASSSQMTEAQSVLRAHHPERIELLDAHGHPTARG